MVNCGTSRAIVKKIGRSACSQAIISLILLLVIKKGSRGNISTCGDDVAATYRLGKSRHGAKR